MRRWGARLTAAVIAALIFNVAACDRRRDERVTIVLPSSTLAFTVVFVADDLGLFRQEGLDVRLQTATGVSAVNAVIGGAADFTIGSGTTFLRAVAQGQKLLAVANLIDRPLVEIVLRRDLTPASGLPHDLPLAARGQVLAGRTVAVQGIGSITHAWVRYVAAAAGLDVEKDVRITSMEPSTMTAALDAGVIDAFSTSPPFTTESVLTNHAVLLASGLTDAPELLPFAYALLYAEVDTCARRPDTCRRVTKVLAAAVRTIRDDPATVVDRVLKKRFPNLRADLLRASWDRVRVAHVADVRVTAEALEHSQVVSLRSKLLKPADAITDYGAYYTDAFVR